MLWPIEQMGDVLRTFKAVTEEAPNELTIWYHTYQFPPLPEIPEPIRGKGFAAIAVAYLGSRADAEELLAPFRALPGLAMDLMGEVPLAELSSIADEPTDPMPGMQRSGLLTGLDDDAIDALVAVVGADSGSPLPVVQIRHLGGAFAETSEGAGVARSGHRALQPVRARRPRRARAGRGDRHVLRPDQRRGGARRQWPHAAQLPGRHRGPRSLVVARDPRAPARTPSRPRTRCTPSAATVPSSPEHRPPIRRTPERKPR